MDQFELKKIAEDKLLISGSLVFTNVKQILEQSRRLLASMFSPLVLDLSGVANCDSSALALLIELKRFVQAQNKSVDLQNIPEQLVNIAKVSGLEIENI
jgi:phospholipid transport system transporter-binding protein